MRSLLPLRSRLLPCTTFLVLSLFAIGTLRAADAPKPPVVVRVAPARTGEVVRYVSLPATVRANQQATLLAKVGGYVTGVLVDTGDSVKQGQLLAELEVPELAAEMKRYAAESRMAEIDSQRLTDARKRAPDLVVPQALDKATGALDMANALMEKTRTLINFSKITAPFSGVITLRYVDPGAFIPAATSGASKGSAIFTLMDYAVVRVQTGVPELDAVFVKNGQPAKVSIEALPGKIFEGTVSRFAHALDEATRTMLVEVDLPNPDAIIRPGMYANARLGVEKHSDVVVVPAEALVMEKTAAFVFRVADGRAAKVSVTLGFNDGANVEITKGIAAGDTVALPGKLVLVDGQSVQPEGAR